VVVPLGVSEVLWATQLRQINGHAWRNFGTDFSNYEGWNFNSGNYLFTTDTK